MPPDHPAPEAGHAVDAFGLAELAQAAKRGLDSGESFLALELASKGLDRSRPDRALTLKLTHIKALALARTGSYAAARELLRKLPKACQTNPEVAGALARTYKDEAMEFGAGSPAWRRRLQRARHLYLQGYRLGGSQDYFLGINAAATAAWLGEHAGPDGADALANSVRPLCTVQLQAGAAPPDRYWLAATLAELELLQGRDEEASRQYAAARELVTGGEWWGRLSSTRLQALRHCRLLGRDPAPFEAALRFPCLVAFAGHMADGPERIVPRFPNRPEMIAAVADMLAERLRKMRERTPAGFAVCSAAAGADLLFIEAALAQDCPAQVHVVLPWEEEAFLASSVHYGGDFWIEKFRTIRARAASVTTLTQRTLPQLGQSLHSGTTGLGLDYCNECIAGLALQRGRALGAEVRPLALSDGQPADGPGGTESFIAFWQERLGLPVEIIALKPLPAEASRRQFASRPDLPRPKPMARTDIRVNRGQPAIKTMLFADVAGYSKITEEQTANFAPVFLGAISELIATSGSGKPVLSNTWGDALYMVFDEPEHAGDFALQLARMIREGKPWRSGNLLPANLSVRIALHTGPVLLCVDPVVRQMTFTGNHVSHAARIEPVVARGEIYASEAFVAYAEIARRRLQTEAAPFICDYLGLKDLAKNYGRYPLYRVRPYPGDISR